MPAFRSVLALLTVLVVASQATLADAPQNDAGTGGDAGNTRAGATPVAPGSYKGELRAHDDDWYTTSRAASPACVTTDVTGDTWGDVNLAIRTSGKTYGIRAPIVEGHTTRLALAGSAVDRAWEGFLRMPNPAGNDAARPRFYSFSIGEATSVVGDGGLVGDAGGTLTTARPVAGGCSGGTLRPFYGLGDVKDVYSFSLGAPTTVVYSAGSAFGLTLQLFDANNTAVAPAVAPDQLVALSLPAGDYYLSVTTAASASETVEYVFALLGPDPPPGSPCRPHCLATE